MVQADLVEQQSAKRWTYYTLKAPRDLPTLPALTPDEERILAWVREKGSINNTECRNLLGIDDKRAWYLLKGLMAAGQLKPVGVGRWRRYTLG